MAKVEVHFHDGAPTPTLFIGMAKAGSNSMLTADLHWTEVRLEENGQPNLEFTVFASTPEGARAFCCALRDACESALAKHNDTLLGAGRTAVDG